MSEDEKEPPKDETPAPAPASKRPSSPWPSARKSEAPKAADASTDTSATSATSAADAAAAEPVHKAAWGAPLDRLDRGWTKLDARLCAAVLLADAITLVIWISLKAMSSTGTGGAGRMFRCLVTALVLGGITHVLTRKRTARHEAITTGPGEAPL